MLFLCPLRRGIMQVRALCSGGEKLDARRVGLVSLCMNQQIIDQVVKWWYDKMLLY